MPYIEQKDRYMLDPYIDDLSNTIVNLAREKDGLKFAGFLNYVMTRTLLKVFKGLYGKPSYWMLAMMFGVLLTMALELYRRIAVPFEEKKIIENGDLDGFGELGEQEEKQRG